MLRELVHFARHLPATTRLAADLSKVELYESIMQRAEGFGMVPRRGWLAEGLVGNVLEVGCGTGMLFPYYGVGVHVDAVEPDVDFRAMAEQRAARADATIEVHAASGESLPFPDGHFDAARLSLVLCSVDSVADVLCEVHRVLKPRASLRMLEHVRSPNRVKATIMDVLNPLWLRVNRQGCNMNRSVVEHLAPAGFELVSVEPDQLWTPGVPAFPLELVEAVAVGGGAKRS